MSKTSEVSLLNFFIFNPAYGPKEGEEEKKILYYHPKNAHIDTKIKQIGLCEAVMKFTQTFTDKPCESIHTQKTRQLFFQPEPDFCLVMTAAVPHSEKTKDNQTWTEYHEEDVQDSVYSSVLKQAYKMFKLFNGSFEEIVSNTDKEGLIQRLDHFYSKYLLTLKLNQSDVLDVFMGIHFLPLDKNTYLRIQCFINLLEATFPAVHYTAFLYNDQLVWSGLEQDDMRVLYQYLTTSLFPLHMEHELHSSSHGGATAAPTPAHYGKYILGPPNLNDETKHGRIPQVHLHNNVTPKRCHLVVYRALSASICLLIDGNLTLSFEYLRRLDKFLGPQLSSLASDISDQYGKRVSSSSEVQFKYVYFNHMNLAQKTTVHTGSGHGTAAVPQDVLRVLADLNNDLNTVTAVEDGETVVKMCSDCWVVSKKSDQREFYVILNQKNANLIEINEEVKRLCSTHFSNIFFLD